MGVERQVRRLDAIIGELLAPLLNARPRPSGWRLAGWDVEQGICITLARGDEWVLVELEERDDARECFERTARFNVCARYVFNAEKSLSAFARAAVLQVASLVRARESALPELSAAAVEAGSEVRELLVERVLMPQGPRHYYLNPYAGCMIGCNYCYVAGRAALSRRIEGRAELPWGRYVDVKVNAAEVLRREVRDYEPGIVRMSPILTDPYQPLEKRYRITRQCLEVLAESEFEPGILTRAGRIIEDIPVLKRFRRAVVGVSIPTDDDSIRAQFEPNGDPIEARLAALEACHTAGLVTVAVVQPMLPMNPERLAEKLAPITKVVRIDRMYEMPRVLPLYERAGRLDAAQDIFFEETEQALRRALQLRGVNLDPLDDLGEIFA